MSLGASLVRCWYARRGWCRLLIPLSWLFGALVWLRRWLYAVDWLRSYRLPVPVIVIGNLTAGGTGKTPLAIWLVEHLRANGYRPGVVSRGYGGSSVGVRSVSSEGDPRELGDEPLLLARRLSCPVWVGRKRVEAASALLAAHPEVDVIVADDGLQHYSLARDVEIAVVDGSRHFGNGLLLPAGPLREKMARLGSVDAIVVNGGVEVLAQGDVRRCTMSVVEQGFYKLGDPTQKVSAEYFHGRPVHALAGIGNPERFFDGLRLAGISAVCHPFPDHHAYEADDLPSKTLIMTEKDAVKCERYGHPDAWVLVVDAVVSGGLETIVLNKLETRYGRKAA